MSSPVPLDQHAKERVKAAIDIVDLVGSYLPLRRAGRNFVALCPWHDDTRPSLQVNPDRQTFKCWVCNLGGDIFSFVMQREGISFPEALRLLADRAGIVLDSRPPGAERDAREPKADVDDKPTLYRAMAWAVELMHRLLLDSPAAEPARRYLGERGIHQQSIDRFQLGYAPNEWTWLADRAGRGPFSPAVLERVGVLGRSQQGHHYDRFKGRVLFPIRNSEGKPIALGGRILPETAATATGDRPPAKYINSPETPLFSKNRELYGLDVARGEIARAKNVLVMEGYTDCIIAHQHGFANAVAVLGTALGEQHVRRLRFADRSAITLVLDGDEAGRRRANEVLELFLAAQVDLRILTLPDGLDPCDFLQQRGAEAFAALVESAVDALEHKVQVATAGLDPNDTHHAQRAAEEILATLAAAPRISAAADRLRRQHVLSRLARRLRVPEEALRARLAALRRSRPEAVRRPTATPGPGHPSRAGDEHLADAAPGEAAAGDRPGSRPAAWERELVELLLLEPEAIAKVAEEVEPRAFGAADLRAIYTTCLRLAAARITPDFDRLMLELSDPRLQSVLVDLDELGRTRGAGDAPVRLQLLLDSLRQREEERQQRGHLAAMEERRLDPQEEMKLLVELIEQKRARLGISRPTDG